MKPTERDREIWRGIEVWVDDPYDRLTAKIAFIDARQGIPADDLRAMGIDRPDLRWEAARGYIHLENDRALRGFRRAVLMVFAGGMMEQAAVARRMVGWVNQFDVFDTVARVKRFFGKRAGSIVADEFLPAELREGL